MRYLVGFPSVALALLAGFLAAAQPHDGEKDTTQTLLEFNLDVVTVCLESCEGHGSYVIEVRPSELHAITDWLHCGPITAQSTRFKKSVSFKGPGARKLKEGPSTNADDLRYEGSLTWRVMSDGFPMKIDFCFTHKDLAKEETLFEIKETATFGGEREFAVARDREGSHLLLMRLVRRK